MLTLAQLAEVLAYEKHFAGRLEALHVRLEVGADEVKEACRAWSEQIAEGLARSDPTLLMSFANVFAQIEKRILSLHPPLDTIEPDQTFARAKPKPQVAKRSMDVPSHEEAAEASAEEPARDVVVPTYLQAALTGSSPARSASLEGDSQAGPVAIAHQTTVDVHATTDLPIGSMLAGDAPVHPFVPGEAGEAPSALRPTEVLDAAELPDPATSTETEELDPRMFASLLDKSPMPFLQAGADDLERIEGVTLEQYAAIVLSLKDAADRDHALKEAGVQPSRWQSISDSWNQRLRSEPELMGRWRALMRSDAKDGGA